MITIVIYDSSKPDDEQFFLRIPKKDCEKVWGFDPDKSQDWLVANVNSWVWEHLMLLLRNYDHRSKSTTMTNTSSEETNNA